MPRGRPRLDHDAMRIEIAESACDTIRKHGLPNLTLKGVAQQLGVSIGLLQHYFPSKQDLMVFVEAMVADPWLEQVLEKSAKVQTLDDLQEICEVLLPFDKETYEKWLIVFAYNGQAIGSKQSYKAHVKRYTRGVELFATAITNLQKRGVIDKKADPDIEAFGLVAMMEGLAGQVVFSREGYKVPLQRELMKRYIVTSLGKPLK